jgi:hypothetical protein
VRFPALDADVQLLLLLLLLLKLIMIVPLMTFEQLKSNGHRIRFVCCCFCFCCSRSHLESAIMLRIEQRHCSCSIIMCVFTGGSVAGDEWAGGNKGSIRPTCDADNKMRRRQQAAPVMTNHPTKYNAQYRRQSSTTVHVIGIFKQEPHLKLLLPASFDTITPF